MPHDEHSMQRARRRMTVVDACSYGRLALKDALMGTACVDSVNVAPSLRSAFLAGRSLENGHVLKRVLVVRLPPAPGEALQLLLQLGEFERLSRIFYLRRMVLSPFDVNIVRRLSDVIGSMPLWVLSARLPVERLSEAIVRGEGGMMPVPRGLGYPPLLGERERRALLQSVGGMPIHQQARYRGVSEKTIYSLRAVALRKLGVTSMPALLHRLRGDG